MDGLGLDQGEDGESLEFEYEPGISLCSLQSYTHTAAYLQEESGTSGDIVTNYLFTESQRCLRVNLLKKTRFCCSGSAARLGSLCRTMESPADKAKARTTDK